MPRHHGWLKLKRRLLHLCAHSSHNVPLIKAQVDEHLCRKIGRQATGRETVTIPNSHAWLRLCPSWSTATGPTLGGSSIPLPSRRRLFCAPSRTQRGRVPQGPREARDTRVSEDKIVLYGGDTYGWIQTATQLSAEPQSAAIPFTCFLTATTRGRQRHHQRCTFDARS